MGATTVPNPGRPVFVTPNQQGAAHQDPHCSTVRESRNAFLSARAHSLRGGENRG